MLADDDDATSQLRGSEMSAADVVLYGLNIVVPLMTPELLKVQLYVCVLSHGMSDDKPYYVCSRQSIHSCMLKHLDLNIAELMTETEF